MRHLFCVALITLSTLSMTNAQAAYQQANNGPRRGERMERIHAIKVGYLTDRLHLTSDQSAKFWPVYNQYEDEQRATRRNFFQKYQNSNNGGGNEQESRQFIEDNLDYQAEELALKRKYKDQLLKIISAQQLASLYEAERDFKKLLLQQLRNGRGGGNGGGDR